MPDVRFPEIPWDKRWVVFAKPAVRGAERVLDYLGRYVHRTATTDKAIVHCNDDNVVFAYRRSSDGRRRTMTLPAHELLRRFLQHVVRSKTKALSSLCSRTRPGWDRAASSRRVRMVHLAPIVSVEEAPEAHPTGVYTLLVVGSSAQGLRVCCGAPSAPAASLGRALGASSLSLRKSAVVLRI